MHACCPGLKFLSTPSGAVEHKFSFFVMSWVSSSQVPGWSGLSNARVTIFGDVYPLPAELQVSFLVPFVVRYCNQLGN